DNPTALLLRAMNMLYEGLREKGALIVVPSSALDSMNLGAVTGMAAMAGMSPTLDGSERKPVAKRDTPPAPPAPPRPLSAAIDATTLPDVLGVMAPAPSEQS